MIPFSKIPKKYKIPIFSAVIIVITFSLLLTCAEVTRMLEQPMQSFRDYSELKNTPGVLSSGWFPAWLPVEAKNIVEIHDIDSNERFLYFEVPHTSNFLTMPPCENLNRNPSELTAKIGEYRIDAPAALQSAWTASVKGSFSYVCRDSSALQSQTEWLVVIAPATQQVFVRGRTLYSTD